MTDLPSKDTIEAIEKRIGKWPIKTVLWVLVLTAVISCGGIIVSGLRQSFTWLRPYLPQIELNETAFVVANVLVYVLLVFGGWVVTRRFQEVARAAEHAVDRENVALDAIVESEEKIKGLNKKIGNVENRLDNIEKKVSDELPDILTKQLLEETDKRYFHKAELSKGPAEPNMKVEVGRKLLREATADVRDAFREPVSLDTRPTVEREWLAMQVSKLATEILSPDALKDLEAFESAQNAKRALREQGGDAKDHAMKLVDYLEALAEDLTEDDLDEDIDLPGSFGQFRKAHGG